MGLSIRHATDVRKQLLGSWSTCIFLPVCGGREGGSPFSGSTHRLWIFIENTCFYCILLEKYMKKYAPAHNCNFHIYFSCIISWFCMTSCHRVEFFTGIVQKIKIMHFPHSLVFLHVQRPWVEYIWPSSTLSLVFLWKEQRFAWL